MDDFERYRFDLNGYLALPGALAPGRRGAAERRDGRADRGGRARRRAHPPVRGVLDWGPEVRALIDHEPILPYPRGDPRAGFRLDHDYADLIRHGKGPIGTKLHGGAMPYDAGQSYTFVEGRPRSGLLVVAYNLCDVNPGDGGFGCVPGSHKANLPFPETWKELEVDEELDLVRAVTGPAGTAIVFTEAMTHGTLPWRGAGERRTLFFKYDPGPYAYGAAFYDRDRWPDLTERQRAILKRPTPDTRAAPRPEPGGRTDP